MSPEETAPYGGGPNIKRIRTHHLQQMKESSQKWSMLTAYDQYAAAIFDEAGIEVLLIGDSASNNVFANETSLPVTVDELLPLVRAVSRSAKRALIVADLPFGSYQASPEQALHTAVRFMKEAGAHAVKLEGGPAMAPQVKLLTDSGIPVMGHIGFTPQSEHNLGGYRVQGRGDSNLIEEAKALEAAGAFAIVMEMVPAPIAAAVTKALRIPTVGIGAGIDCDAQVLVWQDMMGLRTGKAPRFVKRYADLHTIMLEAAETYRREVSGGDFPAPEHSFES